MPEPFCRVAPDCTVIAMERGLRIQGDQLVTHPTREGQERLRQWLNALHEAQGSSGGAG